MKNQIKIILMFSIIGSAVFAGSWRTDLGYYTASGLWVGSDFKTYKELTGASEDKATVKSYLRETYFEELSSSTSASFSLEASSFKTNFDFGNAKDGRGQSGLSEVNVSFSHKVFRGGDNTVAIEYGASFPGSEYENSAFDSLGSGVTTYKFGVDWSYASNSVLGFNFNLGYWYRPGQLYAGGANSEASGGQTLDIPDLIVTSIGVPLYFGSDVLIFQVTNKNSLSGIDISADQFSSFATAAGGRPPFPATKEDVTSLQISWSTYIGHSSYDISISRQIAGKNTDQGYGINLGYTF